MDRRVHVAHDDDIRPVDLVYRGVGLDDHVADAAEGLSLGRDDAYVQRFRPRLTHRHVGIDCADRIEHVVKTIENRGRGLFGCQEGDQGLLTLDHFDLAYL